jgi:dUTP pyrophosphatase
MPSYATEGSAAVDLCACIPDTIGLGPGCVEMIPAGFALDMKSPDIAAMILPRSGLGAKQGVVLANLVGLVDSDYQGEVKVALWNRSNQVRLIEPMDRIAQLVFVPVVRPVLNQVKDFEVKTQRGEGGFGSTGV